MRTQCKIISAPVFLCANTQTSISLGVKSGRGQVFATKCGWITPKFKILARGGPNVACKSGGKVDFLCFSVTFYTHIPYYLVALKRYNATFQTLVWNILYMVWNLTPKVGLLSGAVRNMSANIKFSIFHLLFTPTKCRILLFANDCPLIVHEHKKKVIKKLVKRLHV